MTHERISDLRVRDDAWLEADLSQEPHPPRTRKESLEMTVVRYAGLALPGPQEDGEIHDVRGVGAVGIDHPPQESDAASLGVASPVVDALLERLPDEVGDEERDPTRAAVLVRGPHHGLEVRLGGHVANGVMGVDGVEGSTEA